MNDNAATAILVFETQADYTVERLRRLLTDVLTDQGDAPGTGPTMSLGGVTAETESYRIDLDLTSLAGCSQLGLRLRSVTLDPATAQARLAALTWRLLTRVPATHIEWLNDAAILPRQAFLDALSEEMGESSPAGIAPRRITSTPAARSRRRRARLMAPARATVRRASDNRNTDIATHRYEAHVTAFEAHCREAMLRPASEAEIEALEKESGIVPVEARLATWAVSLSVATVSLPLAAPVMIMNVVRGEDMRAASLAMGLAGLFTVLQSSGAIATVLPI